MEVIRNKGVFFLIVAIFFACTTGIMLYISDRNESIISDLQSELKVHGQTLKDEDFSALKYENEMLASVADIGLEMAQDELDRNDDFQAAAEKVLLPYVVEEINYEAKKLSNKRDCTESKTEEQCQADADAYTIEDYREWRDNPFNMTPPDDMLPPPPYELGMQDLGPCVCPPPVPDPCFSDDCIDEPA